MQNRVKTQWSLAISECVIGKAVITITKNMSGHFGLATAGEYPLPVSTWPSAA